MEKKFEIVIVIFLILINIIIGGIFISTLNSITVPEVISHIEIIDIDKDNVLIHAEIEIDNQNQFSIVASDFIVESKTPNGTKIGEILVHGGEIKPNSKNIFQSESTFDLEQFDLKPINTFIRGNVKASFFGIFNKDIPIEIQILVSFDNIVKNIRPPIITINAGINDIDDEGIGFNGSISIVNSNQFVIIAKNLSATITSDNNTILGSISIPDTYIKQNSTKNIPIQGTLSYTALNYKKMLIELHADIGAQIGGFNKTTAVSTLTEIQVPDINELLLIDEVIDVSISAEFKLRLNGIHTTVGLNLFNPTNIPFEAHNLHCKIYGMANNESVLIAEKNMTSCDIISQQEICVNTIVILPYIKILKAGGSQLLPDWYGLGITGDFSIKNTTQSIPISLNGYIDTHFFT